MSPPDFTGAYPTEWPATSLRVKEEAGYRCVRCRHRGAVWVPTGVDPDRFAQVLRKKYGKTTGRVDRVEGGAWIRSGRLPCDEECDPWYHQPQDRRLRVLTVHHVDNDKGNLAWWNLAALCQVCHLQVQGRVVLAQTWAQPHSRWFWPYVAGYYASTILGQQLSRQEVEARLPELLQVGQPHLDYQ